jgi:hypothetical protein
MPKVWEYKEKHGHVGNSVSGDVFIIRHREFLRMPWITFSSPNPPPPLQLINEVSDAVKHD